MGIGSVTMALGAVLTYGNLSSRLATLPFVGVLALALGGMIVAFGNDRSEGDASVRR